MDLVTEEIRTVVRPISGRRMLAARLFAVAVLAGALHAADFSLGIGPPVAGNSYEAKGALFVVRPQGCTEAGTFKLEASGEALVGSARKSQPLKPHPMQTMPGVFAIFKEWKDEGVWVVRLRGTCQSAVAGGVVPIGPKGFVRESSKFFSHAASDADVEAALKSLAAQNH